MYRKFYQLIASNHFLPTYGINDVKIWNLELENWFITLFTNNWSWFWILHDAKCVLCNYWQISATLKLCILIWKSLLFLAWQNRDYFSESDGHESDSNFNPFVGSSANRAALELPTSGPLKLEDVKIAYVFLHSSPCIWWMSANT